MNKELKRLEDFKNRITNTCNLKFIQQDFHRASSLAHIIGRIELVEEAINSYNEKYQ